MRRLPLFPLALTLSLPWLGIADDHGHGHDEECDHADHDQGHDHDGAVNWLTGDGTDLGGFLFPHLFALGSFGGSTGDPADLAVGDHDPVDDATLQSLEFAATLSAGKLTGFGTYSLSSDAAGDLNGNFEEGFLHYEIFEGVTIGGGQFLNDFGFQNVRHNHAWEFVDQHLVNGRMLNEGELTTQGGEIILDLPTPWASTLTVGGGGVRRHAHGDHAHGHEDEEAEFEAELGNFDNWVVSGNYEAVYGEYDQMRGTLSFAVGENGFGETTQVYGIGHEITWNPVHSVTDAKGVVIETHPGHEFGAGSLRWRTEAMFRNVGAISGHGHHDEHEDEDHHDEHGHEEDHDDEDHHEDDDHHDDHGGDRRHADLDEFGIYTMLQYGLTDRADLAFRAEWVSGINEAGLDERWRLSPAITAFLNDQRTVHGRIQYNFDHGSDFGSEHSIWFQIGIAWGHGGHDCGAHGHEH